MKKARNKRDKTFTMLNTSLLKNSELLTIIFITNIENKNWKVKCKSLKTQKKIINSIELFLIQIE